MEIHPLKSRPGEGEDRQFGPFLGSGCWFGCGHWGGHCGCWWRHRCGLCLLCPLCQVLCWGCCAGGVSEVQAPVSRSIARSLTTDRSAFDDRSIDRSLWSGSTWPCSTCGWLLTAPCPCCTCGCYWGGFCDRGNRLACPFCTSCGSLLLLLSIPLYSSLLLCI